MPAVDGQLFIEAEATPGTYDAPDGADAVHAENWDWSIGGPGVVQRGKHLGTQERSAFPYKPANIFANVKFTTELKAGANATTAGEQGILWKAAGFQESVAANVTYSHFSDPNAAANDYSLSYLFEESVDGNSYSGAGLRLGWEIVGSWDKAPVVNWSGVSSYVRPADQGALTSPTYATPDPFVTLNTTGNPFQFHSYDMIVRSFRIRSAVRAVTRPSMGDAVTFGYKWPAFLAWGDSDVVTIEIELELVDQTAFAIWSKFEAPAGGLDGQIIYVAGSRTLTLDCDDTVFGAPVKVRGQPNMYRLSGAIHDFNLVYA